MAEFESLFHFCGKLDSPAHSVWWLLHNIVIIAIGAPRLSSNNVYLVSLRTALGLKLKFRKLEGARASTGL